MVIIGVARQGIALARYLAGKGAKVALNDRRSVEEMLEARQALADVDVEWALGGHPMSLLDEADLVCPSGGVPLTLPLVEEAKNRGIQLSNDSQIFLEAAPCKVVGITGSAGKTTATTLVGRMGQAANDASAPQKVWIGGNIGSPLIAEVDEMQVDDLAVMELSSFQLEIMTRSPQVAGLLNLTPNHLDRHGDMEAYIAAKTHILSHQTADDTTVLGREDEAAWGLRSEVKGKLVSFGWDAPPAGQIGTFERQGQFYLQDEDVEIPLLSRADIELLGEHNVLNVLAACALAFAAGLPVTAMQQGVAGFRGVAHRLEFVRSWGGADWYNDSIATAPERAIAAIRSFEAPLVLLAGGRDKDLPWEDFAELVRQQVDHLVVFGETAGLIERAVGNPAPDGRPYTLTSHAALQEAVQGAAEVVEPGDVVLLSPGGTSFDEFIDFAQRGEWFKQYVMELP